MSAILDQSITIIGAGNVATSIAHSLQSKGIRINEIYSRTLANAQILSKAIGNSNATSSLDFSNSQSDIFIIAISDDAIPEVSQQITFPEHAYLFHTSGTVSIDALKHTSSGIFYPLQTFAKGHIVDFENIPILIEGKNQITLDRLKLLGETISHQVIEASEAERQQLHIAAVFASNFTNRMLAFAEEILEESTLDIEILKPLVLESIQNIFRSNPNRALTGPAKRGDQKTIEKHLKSLEDKPELIAIYKKITESIISKFSPQN